MENAKELLSSQELKDIISGLPFHGGFLLQSLRKYQGVWTPEFVMPGVICGQRYFQARPTDILIASYPDILIASYPKCGTTWLKALAFSALTRSRNSLADHPLHGLNPQEIIRYLEDECADPERLSKIDAMSAPRLLSTHMTFSQLPVSIKTSSCRLLYICRDPKDALISRWYFSNRILASKGISEALPLERLVEHFCDGTVPYGSIWDHALSYWNESLRAPERVLFIAYEELLEAPMEMLTRLAEFTGYPFSEEEVVGRVPAETLRLCSFDSMRDAALKQNREMERGGKLNVKTEFFYRKGTSGDGKSHLTLEMAQRIDHITEEKLRGTGLTLGRASSVGITTLDA